MRVVFLAPRFHTNQRGLVECLVRQGCEVGFIVVGRGRSEETSLAEVRVIPTIGISRWIDRRRNPDGDFGRFARWAVPRPREVWSALGDLKPNTVVIRVDAFGLAVVAMPWIATHRCDVVLYSQGPKYRSYASIKRRMLSWIIKKILCWEWMTPVEALPGVPVTAGNDVGLAYLPFVHDVSDKTPEHVYDTECPRLLSIGKFMPRKNHLAVIDAVGIVLRSRPCRLTIVGENTTDVHRRYRSEVEQHIEALGLQHVVTLLENLPHERMHEVYQNHDVFVLASWGEPASVSQLEAMAHGLPAVICEENGTASYVEDYSAGVVTARTPEDVARGILEIISGDGSLERYGRKAVAVVERRFSCRANWDRIRELLGLGDSGGARLLHVARRK